MKPNLKTETSKCIFVVITTPEKQKLYSRNFQITFGLFRLKILDTLLVCAMKG